MNPIILADNRFLDGAITATGVTDDTRLHITDLRPYTFLIFPTAGTKYITVDCATAKTADALGIIGHNLSAAAAAITLESSADNSTWTTRLGTFSPTTNRAILRTFTKAHARYWRIKIISASVAPMLAVVMLGERLEFPFPPDNGFIPYSEGVEVDSNDSKTGQPLGAIVRYFPVEIAPSFTLLERDWVEDVYLPFREGYSRYRKYFFWAWDLETYPQQVFYVQDTGRHETPVSTLQYYNKLKLTLKGVAEP